VTIFYAALSVVLGFASLGGSPAALPVLGLAFGAAALVRESQTARRSAVYASAACGCAFSAVATALRLVTVHR